MTEVSPTDWTEVSKEEPAQPIRMKRTRIWGIQAYLVGVC